jgi:hypothetical protein
MDLRFGGFKFEKEQVLGLNPSLLGFCWKVLPQIEREKL